MGGGQRRHLQGRKATGSAGIKDDMENAGATWVEASAFQEGNQVWGRVVADIPDFCRTLVEALSKPLPISGEQ